MKEEPASGVYVVRVGMTDYPVAGRAAFQLWAVAVPRDEAVAAVKRKIPSNWTVELTDERLTVELVRRLAMRPGDAKEITS